MYTPRLSNLKFVLVRWFQLAIRPSKLPSSSPVYMLYTPSAQVVPFLCKVKRLERMRAVIWGGGGQLEGWFVTTL